MKKKPGRPLCPGMPVPHRGKWADRGRSTLGDRGRINEKYSSNRYFGGRVGNSVLAWARFNLFGCHSKKNTKKPPQKKLQKNPPKNTKKTSKKEGGGKANGINSLGGGNKIAPSQQINFFCGKGKDLEERGGLVTPMSWAKYVMFVTFGKLDAGATSRGGD